jgi:tRNA nucleotidyltransferase/poly(A) polymerase
MKVSCLDGGRTLPGSRLGATLEKEQNALVEARECELAALEQARLKRETSKLLAGLFASRAEEEQCEDYIREIVISRKPAVLAIEALMDLSDRVPGSKAGQNEMLDESNKLERLIIAIEDRTERIARFSGEELTDEQRSEDVERCLGCGATFFNAEH